MGICYREFLITRGSKDSGLNAEELEGRKGGRQLADITAKVLYLQNLFPYDDYINTGYFIFYAESLKSFAAVKGEAGKEIDQRTNMELYLRLPLDAEGDGFEECLGFLMEWGGISREDVPVTTGEICSTYRISENWLAAFFASWVRSTCKNEAEPLCLFESGKTEAYGMRFACSAARLCYGLLPAGNLKKYSFSFHAPKTYSSFRLTLAEEPGSGICFDLGKDISLSGSSPENLMAKRVVREYMEDEEKGKRFLNGFDRYYINSAGYENMMWNFYYYLLDTGKELPCNTDCFYYMEKGLEKQNARGIEKAVELYGKLLSALIQSSLSREEGERVVFTYLQYLLQRNSHTEEEAGNCWKLFDTADGEGNNETALTYLEQIKPCFDDLYYVLMKKGLEEGREYLLEQLGLSRLNSTESLETWPSKQQNKTLLQIDAVKGVFLEQMKMTFDKNPSAEECMRLVRLGRESVGDEATVEIAEGYLREKAEEYAAAGDITGWESFLRARRKIWNRFRKCLEWIQEQYIRLAENAPVPFGMEEAKAMMHMGNHFLMVMEDGGFEANTAQVQLILIERMCECLRKREAKKRDRQEFAAVLKRFCGWQTGSYLQGKTFAEAELLIGELAAMTAGENLVNSGFSELLAFTVEEGTAGKEELYGNWLQRLTDFCTEDWQAEGILRSLEREKNSLNSSFLEKKKENLFAHLMDTAKKTWNIYIMMYIVKSVECFGMKSYLEHITDLFWEDCPLYKFPEIFRQEQVFWKQGSVLIYPRAAKLKEKLYELYREFHSTRYGAEQAALKLNSLKQTLKEPADIREMEKFLIMVLRSWMRKTENSIEFSVILDFIMAYWEDKESVKKAVCTYVRDKDEQKDILGQMEKEYINIGQKEKYMDLCGDSLKGVILGTCFAAVLSILLMLADSGNKFIGWIVAAILLVAILIGISAYLWYIKTRIAVSLTTILAGTGIAVLLTCPVIFLGKSTIWIVIIDLVFSVISALALLMYNRRGGRM